MSFQTVLRVLMRDPAHGFLQIKTSQGVGHFDDEVEAAKVLSNDSTATLFPRLVSTDVGATNEIRSDAPLISPPTQFTALVLRCAYQNEENDIFDYAGYVEENSPDAHIWVNAETKELYLFRPVEPDTAHDRIAVIEQWQAQQHEVDLGKDSVWSKEKWARVVHDFSLGRGKMTTNRDPERLWRTGAGSHFNLRLPPKLRDKLGRSGDIKRLWEGRGSAGLTDKGEEKPKTPDNYDDALLRAVVKNTRLDLNEEDLIKMIVCRPNSTFLEQYGYGALRKFVHELYSEVNRINQPRGFPAPKFETGQKLSEALYIRCFETNSNTGLVTEKKGVPLPEKTSVIMDWLKHHEAQFFYFQNTGETVFVLDNVPYTVSDKDANYRNWFMTYISYFPAQSAQGKAITDGLRLTIQNDPQTRVSKNHHWGRRDKETLYLCLDPNHRQMVRITNACGVELIDNGTAGVTLRGAGLRRDPFQPVSLSAAREGWKEFIEHVHHGQALHPVDRVFSTVWNIVSLIPGHTKRPMKFHYGREGSGKTESASDWGTVVYGCRNDTSYSNTQNFLRDLNTGGPCVIHDNAEAKQRRKMEDIYNSLTTGGSYKSRVLYTTDDAQRYECNGSIFITAIEPMNKPEELRRTFEFQFDRQWHGPRLDDLNREKLFNEGADRMLHGLLLQFAERILPDIESKYADAVAWIEANAKSRIQSKGGFLSWYAWMLLVARSIGRALWDSNQDRLWDADALFMEWVAADEARYMDARTSSDPLLTALRQFVSVATADIVREQDRGNALPRTCGSLPFERNPDTGAMTLGPATLSEFLGALSEISRRQGTQFPYTGARTFHGRMRAIMSDPSFAAAGWSVTKMPGKAHGNIRRYTFTYTPS